jgi:hypothetical protein
MQYLPSVGATVRIWFDFLSVEERSIRNESPMSIVFQIQELVA